MCHNNAASISIQGKLTRGSKRILMTQSLYGHRIKDSKNKQTSNLKAASVGRQRLICLLVSLCLDCNFLFAGRAGRPRTENLGFTSWIYCREKMRLWIQLQLYTTIKHVLGFVACRRRHHVCGALRLRVADGVRPDVQKRRQAADCQQHVRVKSLQPLPPPHAPTSQLHRASEQIFRVARGRGRVQTRRLMSAAGAGDSNSESDPLHLLAVAKAGWHSSGASVSCLEDLLTVAGWLVRTLRRGCCGVWTGTGRASTGMNFSKIKVTGGWAVPSRTLLLIVSADCTACQNKKQKLYTF